MSIFNDKKNATKQKTVDDSRFSLAFQSGRFKLGIPEGIAVISSIFFTTTMYTVGIIAE